MSRPLNVLLCSSAAAGHVHPATPIAAALVERGHNVHWYTGGQFSGTVERTGAAFEPIRDAYDPVGRPFDERFPARAGLEGLAGLKFDLKHLFLDEVPGQISDLRRILADFPADVLLVDTAFSAAAMLHELGGPQFATYGISVLPIPSRDVPPLGAGRAPSNSPLVRWRDRLVVPAATKLLFRDVQRHHLHVRQKVGLPATSATVFDTFVSPYLYLQGSAASFEYPRRDLPEHVHFVGPLRPGAPAAYERPAWWGDLDTERTVVLVTQGTVATGFGDLVEPAIAGLADDDVFVVATADATAVRGDLPANARLEPFIPFGELLPHVDVMVTNGGYGGVQMALAHGIPLVVAGATEDKPEIAARVAWTGVGINLATKRPTAEDVGHAVRRLLADEQYRRRAVQVQRDGEALGGAATAADLLEQMAITKAPVRRLQPAFASATT